MLTLKRELNFLLWTTDVPEVPENFPILVKSPATPESAKINIQCVSHSLITAAIFANLGYAVTTRAGIAFVLDTSPDGNPGSDHLNQIGKHWWLTVNDQGLVDLSLNSETENPLIYFNRSVGGRWQVGFSDYRTKLDAFLSARQRGCFYFTFNKQQVTPSALAQSLGQIFTPAKECGLSIPYNHIVHHCEQLISGAAESLTGLTQKEAWQRLHTSSAERTHAS